MSRYRNKVPLAAGFSLVEVIMSIGIIGLLSAAAVPLIGQQMHRAKISSSQSMLHNVKNSMVNFYADLWMYVGEESCDSISQPGPDWLLSRPLEVTQLSNGPVPFVDRVEDLDNHMFELAPPCQGSGGYEKHRKFLSSYLEERDMVDEWQYGLVLRPNQATRASPSILYAPGATEGDLQNGVILAVELQ